MQDLVIGNGTIATFGTDNRLIERGALAIRDGRIAEVGTMDTFLGKYPGARFLDARGKLIMPGLINAHMHFYSSFARGMGLPGFAPKSFTDVLEGLWWRLDKALSLEDVHYSALVAAIECIRKGTTTVIDHHASPRAVLGSLDRVADATLAAGIRACLCYEVSDRDGVEVAHQGLEENVRFAQRCSQADTGGQLAAAMGLHASFTLSDATLAQAAEHAASLSLPAHIHMAEDLADVTCSVERYRARPLARLQRAGLLARPALLAHCIHLDEAEHETLRSSASWVLHNPQSNLNNAVGTAPIPSMMRKGLQVALGTDGMTSNMFEELRTASLVHKPADGPGGGLGFGQLYELGFSSNARLASSLLGIEVGHLTEGAAADVIIVDYTPFTPLDASSFLGHLMFGIIHAPVTTTIAKGAILMEDYRILALDEPAIAARASELAVRTWKRFASL